MPGLEGDLEEWQTQEVNVTRGKKESIDVMLNCRFLQNFIVKLASLVIHAVVTFLCLVCACLLSVGFQKFCSQVTSLGTYVK